MNQKKVVNKGILKIKDEIYFVSNVYYIITGIVTILAVKLPIYFEVSNTVNQLGHLVAVYMLFSGIFGVFYYFRSNAMMIDFNENSLYNGLIGMEINDVKEIYRVSFLFVIDLKYGIPRYNLFRRLILILLIPIIGTLYIINLVFKKIYYKEKTIHDILMIIGKNDKQIILVQLPLKDKEIQKELEEYCKKYLNTDIKTLKTRFFIPNNEKWFIETK